MLGNTNAKVGNSGGVTEDVIADFYGKKDINSSWSPTQSGASGAMMYRAVYLDKFTDKYAIVYTAPYSGTPTVDCVKYSAATDFVRETISSVTLPFGVSMYSSITFQNYCSVAEDKRYVVICGVSSNTNLYILALTKDNNNDYIFDTNFTTIEFDTGVTGNIYPQFISNDTFVVTNGTSANVYKIENGTLTSVKTITLDITPTMRYCINGYLIVATTSKFEVIDVDSENILYSESLSINRITLTNNHIIVATTTTSTPFYIYSISGQTITKETFTFDSGIFATSYTEVHILREENNNSYVLLLNFDTVMAMQLICIDFTSNTIKKCPVSGNFRTFSTSSSSGNSIYTFLQDKNNLFLFSSYQGSRTDYAKYDIIYEQIASEITYKDNKYYLGV